MGDEKKKWVTKRIDGGLKEKIETRRERWGFIYLGKRANKFTSSLISLYWRNTEKTDRRIPMCRTFLSFDCFPWVSSRRVRSPHGRCRSTLSREVYPTFNFHVAIFTLQHLPGNRLSPCSRERFLMTPIHYDSDISTSASLYLLIKCVNFLAL